jgi:hypothetical protein
MSKLYKQHGFIIHVRIVCISSVVLLVCKYFVVLFRLFSLVCVPVSMPMKIKVHSCFLHAWYTRTPAFVYESASVYSHALE